MGTTLTGTTPQDTYDSLIKVTDNGPISGTLKALSDGLGNDSTLSLSTTAASIAGTLAVSGNATFDTSTLVVDATNNRVGIGTATPTAGYSLSVVGAFGAAVGGAYVEVGEFDRSLMILNHSNPSVNANLFEVQKSGTGVFTINPAGNVGIGVTPQSWFSSRRALEVYNGGAFAGVNAGWLEIWGNSYLDAAAQSRYLQTGGAALYQSGNVASGGHVFFTAPSGTAGDAVTLVERARIDNDGLKFNGDTAAANALDDYEEGTWTMGVTFGGLSVGVTTSANTGTYTKIGRQVTVNGFLVLTSKGSSTGTAVITGLPFTVASGVQFFSPPTLRLENITFTNQFQGYADVATTLILLQEVTTLGANSSLTNADFANNSSVMVSLTYFV